MEAIIRNIGNSKGIIIPKYLVDKYQLFSKVDLVESEFGIIISPIEKRNLFQEKLENLKRRKAQVYEEMSKVAESDEAINYYSNSNSELDDIDLDIIEE